MSIGNRRERIEIRRKSRVKRTDGGYDTTVSTVATRWAHVRPVRAAEGQEAGRLVGAVTYLIEVDARGMDCRADDIIRWITNGNRDLNVREVRTPEKRSLPLIIVAEYGVANSGAG